MKIHTEISEEPFKITQFIVMCISVSVLFRMMSSKALSLVPLQCQKDSMPWLDLRKQGLMSTSMLHLGYQG